MLNNNNLVVRCHQRGDSGEGTHSSSPQLNINMSRQKGNFVGRRKGSRVQTKP